jgi:phage FluMu protein gp41
MLQTEFEFTLPCGFVDGQGNLHRIGRMRRATARDEIEAMSHPRSRASEAYSSVILLSRVVIRLGALETIGEEQIEKLFATDFAHLQELYLQINAATPDLVQTRCPACGTRIVLDVHAHGQAE